LAIADYFILLATGERDFMVYFLCFFVGELLRNFTNNNTNFIVFFLYLKALFNLGLPRFLESLIAYFCGFL